MIFRRSLRECLVVGILTFNALPQSIVKIPLGALAQSGELEISVDGACSGGITCLGSSGGQCCSKHGYCGHTDDYCGAGCQPAFGLCGPGAEGPSSPSSTPPSSQPTQPAPTCRASTTTATLTSIRWATITVGESSPPAGSTCRVTVTSTRLRTDTSTVVVEQTQMVYLTQTVTTTATVTTKVPAASTVISATVPSPTIPGAAKNCKKWYKTKQDESCGSVSDENEITKDELREWNSSVGRSDDNVCEVGQVSQVSQGKCRIPCGDLWPGYYLCVKA